MLSSWDTARLAQAYGLAKRDVAADALVVAQWRGPSDDLLAFLEKKHHWSAGPAFKYLRTLRRALLGQLPR